MKNTNENISDISIYTIDGSKVFTMQKVDSRKTGIKLPDITEGNYLIHVNTNMGSYMKQASDKPEQAMPDLLLRHTQR